MVYGIQKQSELLDAEKLVAVQLVRGIFGACLGARRLETRLEIAIEDPIHMAVDLDRSRK